MHFGGYAADAHELIMQTRRPLQRYTDGEGFKVFLYCESFYGGDLRAAASFVRRLNWTWRYFRSLRRPSGWTTSEP